MVDTLTERDRFSVYAFDDRIDTVPEFCGPGLAAASDRNRFRAVEFLAKVEARGGTEMAQPLDLAVKQLEEASRGRQPPEAQRDRILVLITDGQVGNEDQILRLLGKRLAGLRIFTLGIDQAVNEGFLKRLATLGGGFCEVVESEDRLDEVMKRLHSRIGTPVLTGLKLEEAGFGIAAETTVPSRLPDLFAGAALQVMGRYQGVPEGSFLLSGQDAAGRRWCEAVSSRVSDNPALAKAWARAYVRELEDRFVTGQGDVRELEKRIIEVSLKYGVLCRFTSYVAVDRSEVVNEGGQRHRVVQPVEMPAGWVAQDASAPQAALGAAPAGGGLLGKIFGRPTIGRYLGKGIVDFQKGVKGLSEDEQASQPPPPSAPPGGADKDIFETDFEVPALEEEPGSEAMALDDADTSLDSSDFELALEGGEEDPAHAVAKPNPAPPPSDAQPPESVTSYLMEFEEEALEDGCSDDEDAKPARRPSKPTPPPPPSVPPRGKMKLRGIGGKTSRNVPPPARQAPGLLGKVFGLFRKNKGKQEGAVPTPESLDLSAYRRRAADLLEPIKSASDLSGPQRLHELGVLAVSLKALIEDLTSVGAPPLEIRPLQTLFADLTALLEQPSSDEAAVSRLWTQAEEVLRVFAGLPVEAPVAGRREGFWK
jgi:hypothetical protein